MIFDAGNTLVFLDPIPVEAAFRRAGASFDPELFHRSELTARAELTARVTDGHDGTEPDLWRAYFRRILELTRVPPQLADPVGAAMRDSHGRKHLWTHTPEAVRAALDRLRKRGFRLAVISNADGRMEGAIRAAGIRDHFEFVIDSGDVGISKPDPEIFLLAARTLALPADRCLYVGDLYPVDVVGARRAGMHAVLLAPAHGTRPAVAPTDQARSLPVSTIDSVADLPEFLQESPPPRQTHREDGVHRA